MADSGYWQRITQSRLSRRRALAGSLAAGAGAAALGLVGCGGGSESAPKSGESTSGLIYTPLDTTSQARPGGVLKTFDTNETPSFDPLTSSAFQTTSSIAYYAYPRMLKWVTKKYPERADGTSEGDLAESYEISQDKLQITFKLRQGVKWDARSPTSGRAADAQDVLFSWQKYSTVNPLSQSMAYNAQTAPSAPVESMSAPDNRTIVAKLRQPDASIVQLFTAGTLFYVLPREADSQFDAKGEVRGHGPFTLTDFRPSALKVWSKNPDYYVKNRPFIEKLEFPIVSEYATRLAQFKAGGIHTNPGVRQEEITVTKRDVPDLLLSRSENFSSAPPTFISFGYEGDSPFKDVRMRQALFMLIDRDALADIIANREQFQSEGLEVAIRFPSTIATGWDGYWLDPTDSKEFGPNGKNITFNPAEAKKLIEAAGYKNGVEVNFYYSLGSQYGSDYTRVADIFPGMLADNSGGLIKVKINPKEYQNDWLPNYYWGYLKKDFQSGKTKGFNGFLYGAERAYPTVGSQLSATHHSDGDRFHGMTTDGKNAHLGDPKVDDIINKIRVEFDLGKQQSLVKDLQKYVAGQAYHNGATYSALNFGLQWPVISNYSVYRSYNAAVGPTETSMHWWLDDTKPPLKRA